MEKKNYAVETMHKFMKLCSNGGSPAEVAALFAEDAFVLPTLWTKGTTPEEILAYFEYFLVPGRAGEFQSMQPMLFSSRAGGIVTGLWDWWVEDDGVRDHARYTAYVVVTPEGPKIKHLHSSLDPQAWDVHGSLERA